MNRSSSAPLGFPLVKPSTAEDCLEALLPSVLHARESVCRRSHTGSVCSLGSRP